MNGLASSDPLERRGKKKPENEEEKGGRRKSSHSKNVFNLSLLLN